MRLPFSLTLSRASMVFRSLSLSHNPFAMQAMEYIEVVRHVLRPGGVWVNSGPLSFHWQAPDPEAEFGDSDGGAGLDPRYSQSVELSYQEIRHAVIKSGFKMLVRASPSRRVFLP